PHLRKQMGFCFGRSKIKPPYINLINTKRPQRNSSQKRLISMPFGNSMQSVSAFLVWCSTFSQGLIFYPQDAASTFFNEML
ncbi:hypothetical protein, partial [Pseudomonas sp. FH1]|uniref:hypothetical protein n=1 Tax=Pseudomonas sp. FH1 TaxID=1284392 RepID=UPI0003DB86D0